MSGNYLKAIGEGAVAFQEEAVVLLALVEEHLNDLPPVELHVNKVALGLQKVPCSVAIPSLALKRAAR